MVEKLKNTAPSPDAPSSAVMQLKESNRLTVPSPVMRTANWRRGEPLKLIAELLEDGRVRLHRHEDVSPAIGEIATNLSSEKDDESLEKLAVLGDRYRSLALDKGARVTLTEEVLLHLDVRPGEYPYLLVRVFGDKVEILSPSLRKKLNQLYRDDTTPDFG